MDTAKAVLGAISDSIGSLLGGKENVPPTPTQRAFTLFEKLYLQRLREVNESKFYDFKMLKGDPSKYTEEQLADFLNEAIHIVRKEEEERRKILEEWSRVRKDVPPYVPELSSVISAFEGLPKPTIQNQFDVHIRDRKKELDDYQSSYKKKLEEKKREIERQFKELQQQQIAEIDDRLALERLTYEEKYDKAHREMITEIDDLGNVSSMNLYILQQDLRIIPEVILRSQVKKVCRTIQEWKETDGPDVWKTPFVLLHCVRVDSTIRLPSNKLYDAVENCGGSYLFMRVHNKAQEYTYTDNSMDAKIPSSICGFSTVLKAMCYDELCGGGLETKFFDVDKILQEPAGGEETSGNLYYLLKNNGHAIQAAIDHVNAYKPQFPSIV